MSVPEVRSQLLAERLAGIRARIGRACRQPVRIVAVTKGFGPEAVEAAAQAGLEDFGENYAQELLAKVAAAPPTARWHFLGALQRNKIARLAPHVYLWHSLDSEGAAQAVVSRCPGARVLVQVALAAGGQRRGVAPDQVPALVGVARRGGLAVEGLMAVGPPGAGPEEVRVAFRAVASLGRSLELPELSMGMSDDYELAVAEGATIVRLGRALFGPRRGIARG
ncbi:MAG TPA: YggS family pyridoxal phosphate-dependent enzyme [Acidimicrobiales bacterium]|nr:YggS family pyridoxal phosphate-dependent enzyme [Acidimicrobiales bacterium]